MGRRRLTGALSRLVSGRQRSLGEGASMDATYGVLIRALLTARYIPRDPTRAWSFELEEQARGVLGSADLSRKYRKGWFACCRHQMPSGLVLG